MTSQCFWFALLCKKKEAHSLHCYSRCSNLVPITVRQREDWKSRIHFRGQIYRSNATNSTIVQHIDGYNAFIYSLSINHYQQWCCHPLVSWADCCYFVYSRNFTSPCPYNLALCSSSFAIVPRWTSSGPSAIRSVRAVAHRCDKTVSVETPAAPWTCIAMSRTFRAIFGAATYTLGARLVEFCCYSV